MEEEERSAQSAKLQELIRRSGPEDLQEANRLMKIMAGYDTRSKTDYRAKAAEEVGKIQQKAKLLEERLEAFQPGETMTEGDVYEELAASLQSAHPKIQKMCEEESDDHEAVAKLFEINDSINRTVERYKLMKKGDIEAASKIAKGTLGTTTGVAKNAANELSLIDFDADGEGVGEASSSAPPSKPGGLEDDLLGLSMDESTISDTPFGQSGAIGLGFGANSSMSFVDILYMTELTYLDIPGPSLISSNTENNSARAPTPAASAASPALTPPNYAGFQPPAQQPPSDPFAALTQPVRQSTPQLTSTTPSMFDFRSNTSTPNPNVTKAPVSTDDDEWAFESALPENTELPSSNVITLTDSVINITAEAGRKSSSDPLITISFKYSNKTPMPISELTFQAAVSKVCPPVLLSRTPLTGNRGIHSNLNVRRERLSSPFRKRVSLK